MKCIYICWKFSKTPTSVINRWLKILLIPLFYCFSYFLLLQFLWKQRSTRAKKENSYDILKKLTRKHENAFSYLRLPGCRSCGDTVSIQRRWSNSPPTGHCGHKHLPANRPVCPADSTYSRLLLRWATLHQSHRVAIRHSAEWREPFVVSSSI